MMVELRGSLGGIGLPALVQLIGELHHSGTLELGNDGTTGRLAFEDGRLVAAEFGQEHGLPALASVARSLKDADFTFVEGAPSPEQTLDFGPPELKSLLHRVMNGEFAAAEQAAHNAAAAEVELELEQPCPLLGFADDRERHYVRPTALHRCYASGAPSLVTSVEQRDLCLSGRFAACPRYRNWEAAQQPARAPEPVAPVAVAPAPAVQERPAPVVQERPAPIPPEPVIEQQPEPERAPEWSGDERLAATIAKLRRRWSVTLDLRGLEFMAIGVMLGVVLMFVVFVVVLPALNNGAAQKPSNVAAPAPALQTAPPVSQPRTVPTLSQPLTPEPRPTSVPTVAPTPTNPPRLPSPTAIVAVAGVSAGRPLMEVRFAQGPATGWIDNPPFALWSDGAYRVQAVQPAKFVALGVPIDAPLIDVIISGTFRKTGGPPGGGYGLIVRDQAREPRDVESQEGQFYVLETGDEGDFGIWRRDGDHWVDLVPWQYSPGVRTGGSPNDLAVRAVGSSLTFVVNGAQLASISDRTLVAGGVGIFVGGDYNQVAVDRFSIALPD